MHEALHEVVRLPVVDSYYKDESRGAKPDHFGDKIFDLYLQGCFDHRYLCHRLPDLAKHSEQANSIDFGVGISGCDQGTAENLLAFIFVYG